MGFISSSSDEGFSCAVMNGAIDERGAIVVASLQVGDNSIRPDGIPEFRLTDTSGAAGGPAATSVDGQLTWDPLYPDEDQGEFDSVAAVRLVLHRKHLLWAVGTVDAVRLTPPRYGHLTKICVVAAASRRLPAAELRWDALHLRLTDASGRVRDLHALPCLPRARSQAEPRRGQPDRADGASFQTQFAEIHLPAATVGVDLKGRVSLSSKGMATPHKIHADDLHAKVLLFCE
jgi:hypothetical protein